MSTEILLNKINRVYTQDNEYVYLL